MPDEVYYNAVFFCEVHYHVGHCSSVCSRQIEEVAYSINGALKVSVDLEEGSPACEAPWDLDFNPYSGVGGLVNKLEARFNRNVAFFGEEM